MSSISPSDATFFEEKYQRDEDPWDFASSDYELTRYQAILHAFDGKHFRYAVEPGCSIGVLSEGIAANCDRLLAFDFSQTAVQRASERCRGLQHVTIRCMELQDVESFEPFDLVVLSEVGYYFSEAQWRTLANRILSEIHPGTTLLAAHWTGLSSDHQISGDLVHQILLTDSRLGLQHSERRTGFRLERWERI